MLLENEDFIAIMQESTGGRPSTDFVCFQNSESENRGGILFLPQSRGDTKPKGITKRYIHTISLQTKAVVKRDTLTNYFRVNWVLV